MKTRLFALSVPLFVTYAACGPNEPARPPASPAGAPATASAAPPMGEASSKHEQARAAAAKLSASCGRPLSGEYHRCELPVGKGKGPSVKVSSSTIDIGEKVQFKSDSAEIEPVSWPLLDEVGRTLRENKDINLVEIDGHADKRGADAANVALTQRRAEAVMQYLVAHGVEPRQLRALGLGAYCPLDPADNDAAYEKNRRVEIHIVRRGGKDVKPGWGGCAEAEKHGVRPAKAKAAEPAKAQPAKEPPAAKTCSVDSFVSPKGTRVTRPWKEPFGLPPPRSDNADCPSRIQPWLDIACATAAPSPARVEALVRAAEAYRVVGHSLPSDPQRTDAYQKNITLLELAVSEAASLTDEHHKDQLEKAEMTLLRSYAGLGLYDQADALYAQVPDRPWRLQKLSAYVPALYLRALAEPDKAREIYQRVVSLSEYRSVHWGIGEDAAPCYVTQVKAIAGFGLDQMGKPDLARQVFDETALECKCSEVDGASLSLWPAEYKAR